MSKTQLTSIRCQRPFKLRSKLLSGCVNPSVITSLLEWREPDRHGRYYAYAAVIIYLVPTLTASILNLKYIQSNDANLPKNPLDSFENVDRHLSPSEVPTAAE